MENAVDERLLEEAEDDEIEIGLQRRILEENKLLWRSAFPAILFHLSMAAVFPVTQAFVGHISQVELAAYALVRGILLRFSNGILTGMSCATGTLCGQAFGAKQYHMLGIYLQRSWIVDTIIATVTLPFYVYATPLFRLLKQEDDIADAAEEISLWFIGVLYASVFSMTTEMYLQAQRKNMFIGILSPITLVLHILLSWIFVSEFGWGITGAMTALVLSRWLFVVLLIIYVFGGWCPNTWTGFSVEAFRDLVPVVKLSLSSGVMLCVQIWYGAILILLAGYTSDATVNISAFSISLNINTIMYMFCFGFLGATGVRISNEIGKGNPRGAKFAIKVALTVTTAFGLLFCIICIVFDSEIPYLFTNDDEVAASATKLSVPLALSVLLNSIQVALSGVAVGTGSQAKAGVINICSYYIVGIPIGCILAYVADYGIMGIWIGLLGGQLMQAVALGYMAWKIDWKVEVEKSRARLHGR